MESIEEGVTGFLRGRDVGEWSEVVEKVLFGMGEDERKEMGRRARARVVERFSKGKMARDIEEELERLPAGDALWSKGLPLFYLGLVGMVVAVGVWYGGVSVVKDW